MPKLSLTSLEVCVGELKLDDKHLFSSWFNSLKELFHFLFEDGDFRDFPIMAFATLSEAAPI